MRIERIENSAAMLSETFSKVLRLGQQHESKFNFGTFLSRKKERKKPTKKRCAKLVI